MKKVLFLLVMVAAFVACSKDDDEKEQTFFLQVYSLYEEPNTDLWGEPEEKLVKKAFVYLFEDENKEIDNEKSSISVIDNGKLKYSNNSVSKAPKYTTNFQAGIFNLEDVQNGDYILWVTFMTEYGGICYSSYKKIKVDNSYSGTMEKKVFHISPNDIGHRFFQEW